MYIKSWFSAALVMVSLLVCAGYGSAAETESILEKSMSDTLDTWREGRYEQLFEKLAHRGKTSRETFVKKMRDSATHPACCWQKIEHFKVLNEKNSEATVYAKIGLEGSPGSPASTTREFKLTLLQGDWKMQMADVFSIAGVSGKKKSGTKRHARKTILYQ